MLKSLSFHKRRLFCCCRRRPQKSIHLVDYFLVQLGIHTVCCLIFLLHLCLVALCLMRNLLFAHAFIAVVVVISLWQLYRSQNENDRDNNRGSLSMLVFVICNYSLFFVCECSAVVAVVFCPFSAIEIIPAL